MKNMQERIRQYKQKYLPYRLLKKMEAIMWMILLIFFMEGCGSKGSSVINSEKQVNPSEETTIILEEGFYNVIDNNPIDKELIWEDSGSENRIVFACEYRDAWNAEIDNTLASLKNYLSEEDYASVNSAYEGWKQYMQNTTAAEQGLFYIGGIYERADTKVITGNSDTYPRVMEAAAARTKIYAVELMSLEYALTGNVEFLYAE